MNNLCSPLQRNFSLEKLSVFLLLTISLSSALQIQCEYKKLNIPDLPNKDGCEATVILTGSLTIVESVLALNSHGSHDDNDRVKVLSIRDQNIGVIPKNILNFFPNLIALNFENIGLTTLVRLDLQPFTAIEALRITENNIQSLSNDLMINNPKLRTFVFQQNNLKRVGAKLVNRWLGLSVLRLNNNFCINGESANDNIELINLLYIVGAFCAPSFETIESDLLSSATFQAAMSAKIAAVTDPLSHRIDVLQLQVNNCARLDQFNWLIGKLQVCSPECSFTD